MLNTDSDCDRDDVPSALVQELEFSSDDEAEVPPQKSKASKSKQFERPVKIIPTHSDDSGADSDTSGKSDGPITLKNIEARSRALDARAVAEAELDLLEVQQNGEYDENEDVDMDGEEDENGDIDVEPFHLPTTKEREIEATQGGADVHTIQRRIREIGRVLGHFKKLGKEGR